VALLLKLGMTVSEVAKHVKRDRSTVIYHRKLVNNLKAYNLEFKEKLEQSEKTIVGKFLSPNKQYNE
jgi:predicted transcriptional regulator